MTRTYSTTTFVYVLALLSLTMTTSCTQEQPKTTSNGDSRGVPTQPSQASDLKPQIDWTPPGKPKWHTGWINSYHDSAT